MSAYQLSFAAFHDDAFSPWNLTGLVAVAATIQAEPYEARQCPICKVWVYTAAGPFAEDDETKTVADFDHWSSVHATPAELSGNVIGFPYFGYNDEPVVAELGVAAALNVLDEGDELNRYLADRARSRGAK